MKPRRVAALVLLVAATLLNGQVVEVGIEPVSTVAG